MIRPSYVGWKGLGEVVGEDLKDSEKIVIGGWRKAASAPMPSPISQWQKIQLQGVLWQH